MQAHSFSTCCINRTYRFIEAAFFLLALASLAYAVVTAPRRGMDLRFFQEGARLWVEGLIQIGGSPIALYPPFLFPLLTPLALIEFDYLLVVWLALNLAAAAAVLHLSIKLWGSDWPMRTRWLFAALLVSWAPFRLTLRNGQISLMITALLAGALLARQKKKDFLAGALLGLSMVKFTMTFPFILYFAWKREWKILSTALLVPLALTEVYAFRLGLTMMEVVADYAGFVGRIHETSPRYWTGTTEIKTLIVSFAGGREQAASLVTIALILAAMAALLVVARRRPQCENALFAAMSLLALWSSYHRAYDSVLCIIPAAVLISFHRRGIQVRYSRFWLAGLGLLIINLPGLLTDRLMMSEGELSGPFGFLGLHIERLLMFGFFWSLLWLLWKSSDEPGEPVLKTASP